jgi:hypothetical protein
MCKRAGKEDLQARLLQRNRELQRLARNTLVIGSSTDQPHSQSSVDSRLIATLELAPSINVKLETSRLLPSTTAPIARKVTMDIDDDEDFYAPEPGTVTEAKPAGSDKAATPPTTAAPAPTTESKTDDKAELEEGEEEDDDGAMDEDDDEDSVRSLDSLESYCAELTLGYQDIDIITERKDGTKAAPPTYVSTLFTGHVA